MTEKVASTILIILAGIVLAFCGCTFSKCGELHKTKECSFNPEVQRVLCREILDEPVVTCVVLEKLDTQKVTSGRIISEKVDLNKI